MLNFIDNNELKDLKLLLRRDDNDFTFYYIFEKDFEQDRFQPNDILAHIQIFKQKKIINFTINNWIPYESSRDFQKIKISVLNYVRNTLLNKLDCPEEWSFTVDHSSESYKNLNSELSLKSRQQTNDNDYEVDR